jgi:hypothetical protein
MAPLRKETKQRNVLSAGLRLERQHGRRCGDAVSMIANPNSISSNLHPLHSCFNLFIYLNHATTTRGKLTFSVSTKAKLWTAGSQIIWNLHSETEIWVAGTRGRENLTVRIM